MKKTVIFTDLDGTLIDHDTYSFDAAASVLATLRDKMVPVVFCSSKTRAEIEHYRRQMDNQDPFIVENGGAIFFPSDRFRLTDARAGKKDIYDLLELGVPYDKLLAVWKELKKEGHFSMTGFSDMGVKEIAEATGLSINEARLAAKREYSEPFLFSDTPAQLKRLKALVKNRNLHITRGGRFWHLIGSNDKGKAVEITKTVYGQTYSDQKIYTVGLGDSANDLPMLKAVDVPVIIRKKTGHWEPINGIESVIHTTRAGPSGWAEAIGQILHLSVDS